MMISNKGNIKDRSEPENKQNTCQTAKGETWQKTGTVKIMEEKKLNGRSGRLMSQWRNVSDVGGKQEQSRNDKTKEYNEAEVA